MRFRLLQGDSYRASLNMGIDESIMYYHAAGLALPTLRIYGWAPPAISIGYFQSMEEEVNVRLCREKGIDVVRRMTGGGAVFHDKEATYSIVFREDAGLVDRDILKSYEKICQAVIEALRHLGIESQFAPLNDITYMGRKVSGNAQTRRNGIVLQHGTILLSVDPNAMFSLLKVPSEKTKDKFISDIRERVNGVNNIAGRKVGFDEMSGLLSQGFEKALGIDLEKGSLTEEEMKYAAKLSQDKYSSNTWNFRR